MADNKYLFYVPSVHNNLSNDAKKLVNKTGYTFSLPDYDRFITQAQKGITPFKKFEYSKETRKFLDSISTEKEPQGKAKSAWDNIKDLGAQTARTYAPLATGIASGTLDLAKTGAGIISAYAPGFSAVRGITNAIKNPGQAPTGFQDTQAFKAIDEFQKSYDKDMQAKGYAGQENWFSGLLYSGGKSVPQMVLAAATGGASIGAKVATALPMLATSYVQYMDDFKQSGMDTTDNTVKARALLSASVDTLSEYVFNVGSGVSFIANRGLGKASTETLEIGSKNLYNEFLLTNTKKTIANQAGFLISKSAEEGFEEGVAAVGAGLIAKFTTNPTDPLFSTPDEKGLIDFKEVGQQMLAGGLIGFMFTASSYVPEMVRTNAVFNKIKDKSLEEITREELEQIPKAVIADTKNPAVDDKIDDMIDTGIAKGYEAKVKAATSIETKATEPVSAQAPVADGAPVRPVSVTENEVLAKVAQGTHTDSDVEAYLETPEAADIRAVEGDAEAILEKISELTDEITKGEWTKDKLVKSNLQLLAYQRLAQRLETMVDKNTVQKGKAISEHVYQLITAINKTQSSEQRQVAIERLIKDSSIFHKVFTDESAKDEATQKMGKRGTKKYDNHRKDLIAKASITDMQLDPAELYAFNEYMLQDMSDVENGKVNLEDTKLSVMMDLVLRKSTEAGRNLRAFRFLKKQIPSYQAAQIIKELDKMMPSDKKTKKKVEDGQDASDDIVKARRDVIKDGTDAIDREISKATKEPLTKKTLDRRLGERIMRDLGPKSNKVVSDQRVTQLLNYLFARYKDTKPVQNMRIPVTPDQKFLFVARIIADQDLYRKVWEDAQTFVESETAKDPKFADVDISSFMEVFNPLYREKTYKDLMYATLKSLNFTMRDMMTDYFVTEDASIERFSVMMREKLEQAYGSPIPDSDFDFINDQVVSVLKDRLESAKEPIAEMLVKKMIGSDQDVDKLKSYQQAMIRRLTNLAIVDDYKSSKFKELWAQELGIPQITQAQVDLVYQTMSEIAKAKQRGETDEVIDAMYESMLSKLASSVPSTKMEQYKAFRRMSMLFNPTTWMRNAIANYTALPMYKAVDVVSRQFERIYGVPQGLRRTAFESLQGDYKAEIDAVVNEHAKKDAIVRFMRKSSKYNITNRLNIDKKIFGTKVLEDLNKFTFKMMSDSFLGDAPVYSQHFKVAMYNKLVNLNYSESLDVGAKQSLINEAMTHASEVATERTFRALNSISSMLLKIQNSGSVPNAIVSVMQPFIVTPTAIMYEGYKFSPLSLLVNSGKIAYYRVTTGKKIRDLDIDLRAQLAKDVPQALVGTVSQVLVGWMLGMLGFLTGSEPENEKEKETWKLLGKQPYALYIPNVGSFTIDWLQPVSMGLTLGAQIAQTKGDISKMSQAMLDSILKNSIVETMGRSFGSGDWVGAVSDLGSDAVIQNFPVIFKRIADVVDPYERNVYQGNAGQILINRILSYIPGASYALEAKVDVWGQPIEKGNLSNEAGIIGRFAQSFILPFRLKVDNMDDTTKAVYDAYVETQDSRVLPRVAGKSITIDKVQYELTPKQYADYQMFIGQEAKLLVDKVVSSPNWISMDSESKVKVLDSRYDKAQEYAKKKLIDKYNLGK